MCKISIWAVPIFIFLIFQVNSEEDEVKEALVQFMDKLSDGNAQNMGWNTSSDPCNDKWPGVTCDSKLESVRKIVLDGFNLSGSFDASAVCMTESLSVLSMNGNNIVGDIQKEISNCNHLTHLYVSGNKFSGNLPDSLSELNNLKRLDISNNNFSGKLPDLPRISGLVTFFAQNNQLTGGIPDFDFSNLLEFNLSNNNFNGPIPDTDGRFNLDSFLGNPELCGEQVSKACPPTPPSKKKPKHSSVDRFLIYSGYIILAVVVLLFIAFKIASNKKSKAKERKSTDVVVKMRKGVTQDSIISNKPSGTSSAFKSGNDNRSEYSMTSVDSGMAPSSSLVVLTSPMVKGLRFEDLLRAPAELLGKGKYGSLYKVMLDDGVTLAVKRIKDWAISSDDFKKRMQKIDQVKHPNALPPVAYYCSKQEKLLVYKYQPNGSLFKLLHGSQNGQVFDWGSRLGVATGIAKALAFMHRDLHQDGIAHGNLKSTNILLDNNMEPVISEYGLMVIENEDKPLVATSSNNMSDRVYSTFKVDVYGFGVILLELLTGKLVQNNGVNLARWVHSAVREEWTVEVFDKALMSEGASEERMVNLLQVALKCIHPSPNERPSIDQVAVMINTIKEEDDRSISSEQD